MLFPFFLLLLFLLLPSSRPGLVTPDRPIPILPYRNNINAITSYTFYLSLQSSISIEPSLIITFPTPLYSAVLLPSVCLMEVTISSTVEILSCQTNNNLITVSIDQTKFKILESGSIILKVFNVKNPATKQLYGVGNFGVKTQMKGGILIDENGNFGSMALADAYIARLLPAPNTVNSYAQMNNDGSTLGGFLTNYVLTFTVSVYLRLSSWFRLEFPIEFTNFGTISCSLTGLGFTLDCQMEGKVLIVKGLAIGLMPGIYKMKLKNIYNPYLKGLTSNFIFESLQPGVNTVIEYYEILGVDIQPGLIKNPVISGYPLNKNLYIDYTISFTPTNIVKEGGMFKILFPSQFGMLADDCRVILGLVNGVNPITCKSVGGTKLIEIKNFATVSPQTIEIKIFATNPSIATTPTDHFQISSLTALSQIIDENLQAGQLIFQNIDKPYYLQIDLYKAMVNSTLGQSSPLDFRLYPKSSDVLPITSGLRKGQIALQIPLWWKNYGGTYSMPLPSEYGGYGPMCMIGDLNVNCVHYAQLYKIDTPSTGSSTRYSTLLTSAELGLGECDVPISIQNVDVTPVPGRFDFRVLTFIDGVYGTDVPIEQDIFTMDIPVTGLPSASVISTTTEQSDVNTVLRTNFQVGLVLPWEGAINFNFTTKDDLYQNSAGWTMDLGFGIAENTFKVIPCRVKIGSNTEGNYGYPASTSHPYVQCFVFSGQTSPPRNPVLQVRGFSSNIGGGTSIEVDIPDVKFCNTINMKCYVELTTSYTTLIENPYTLNYYRASLGIVTGPSTYIALGAQSAPSFQVTFADPVICHVTSYTFKYTSTKDQKINDHIIIKFPNKIVGSKQAFTYSRDGITTTSHSVVVIYNFLTNEIYFLIKLGSALLTGSNTITLNQIRNPNYHSPNDNNLDFPTVVEGIVIKHIYWADSKLAESWTYPKTNAWTDGGVEESNFDFIPSTTTGFTFDRTLDLKSWIKLKISFWICHEIPSTGAIQIILPFSETPVDKSSFDDVGTTCLVYSGLQGIPNKLGTNIKCERINSYLLISGFLKTSQFTSVEVVFDVLSKTTAITDPLFDVKTFFDKSVALNIGSPNENDFLRSKMKGPSLGTTKSFPPKVEWAPFVTYKKLTHMNTRGAFNFKIITNYDISACDINNLDGSPYLYFQFSDKDLFTLPPCAGLDCRLNDLLSCECYFFDFPKKEILMRMPSTLGITHSIEYDIKITTRAADCSATRKEGLEFKKSGLKEITISSVNSGGTTIEKTTKAFDFLPPAFLDFWVHSISKMRSKTNDLAVDSDHMCSHPFTGANSDLQCGLTLFRFYIETAPKTEILPSDDATKPLIYLKFFMSDLPLFNSGFDKDLGTGLAHRSEIPCYFVGISPLTGKDKVLCKLFWGTYPNQVMIIISDFDKITANKLEIHIPKVFNSRSNNDLVKVSMLVVDSTGPLFQGSYDMVNMTYQYPTPDIAMINRETLGSSYEPTFDDTTVDTMTKLNLNWFSKTHAMGPSDSVIFDFPLGWQLVDPCSVTYANIGDCYSYLTCNWMALFLSAATIADEIVTGKITMKTPPFVYLSPIGVKPIKAFIYSRSHLVHIFTYPLLTQTLQEKTIPPANIVIETSNNFKDYSGEYTIKLTMDSPLPGNGAIRITADTAGLTALDSNCRNDVIGGSTLPDLGFACSITGNVMIISLGGNPLKINDLVIVKTNLKNIALGTYAWVVETFYLFENPLNLLTAKGQNNGPAIVNEVATSTTLFWNNQFQLRKILHVGDVGCLQFLLKFSSIMSKNVVGQISDYYVDISMPSGFAPHLSTQVHATWNEKPAYLTEWIAGSPNKVRIRTPERFDIPANTLVYLNITSINAIDNKNGFDVPTTQGTYSFTVDLYSSTSTLVETGSISLFIPAPAFTLYSSSSLITNSNLLTFFDIKFQPRTSVPTNGYLKFYLPTQVTFTQETIFSNDAGSGYLQTDAFPCDSDDGGGNYVKIGGTLVCRIEFGDDVSGKEVGFKVSGFTSSLASSNIYLLRIHGVKNPATTTDSKHVVTRLESYDGSNSILDSSVHYDYTVTNYPISDDIATLATYPGSVVDKNAGATGVRFDLGMSSPQALDKNGMNDYWVVEFPRPVFPLIASTTSCPSLSRCTVISGNNWIVYKPITTSLPANAPTTLSIDNANQAIYDIQAGVFIYGYPIKNRLSLKRFQYKSVGPIISTGLTIPVEITSDYANVGIFGILVPNNAYVKYIIKITMPGNANTIPEGGLIDIEFPTGYDLQESCENDIESQMIIGTWGCVVGTDHTGKQWTITGYKKILAGTVIRIGGYAKATGGAVTGPVIKVYFYVDQARTSLMYTTQGIGVDVASYTGLTFLEFSNRGGGGTPKTVRAGDEAEMLFFVNPSKTFKWLRIGFPTASNVNLPSDSFPICYFGIANGKTDKTMQEADYCKVVNGIAGNSLTIKIKASSLVITNEYELRISSSCGTKSKNGLIFGNAGTYTGTAELSTDDTTVAESVKFSFKVLAPDFTDLVMIIPWANHNQNVPIYIKFTPSVSVPQGGRIVLTFPTRDYSNSKDLFSPDLGFTTVSSGSSIPCSSLSSSLVPSSSNSILCLLYPSLQPQIALVNFQSFSTAIEFFIPDILLPSITTDDGYCDIRVHVEDASGNIINERVVWEGVSPQNGGTPSASGGAFTPININLGATGQTYTISNLVIGATAATPLTKFGRIIVKYPDNFDFNLGTLTISGSTPAGVIKAWKNYMVYSPASDITTNTINFAVGGISNPTAKTSEKLEIFVVFNRIYKYYSGAVTINGWSSYAALSVDLSATHSFESDYAEYRFVFSPVARIPQNGIIKINYPTYASGWNFKKTKVLKGLKNPISIEYDLGFVRIILGKEYAASDGEINIIIGLINPVAGSYSGLKVSIYGDRNELSTIQESNVLSLTIVATPTSTISLQCISVIQSGKLTLNHRTTSTPLQPFEVDIYTFVSNGGSYSGNFNGATGFSVTYTTSITQNLYNFVSDVSDMVADEYIEILGVSETESPNIWVDSYGFLAVFKHSGGAAFEKCSGQSVVIGPPFASSQITFGHYDKSLMNYMKMTVVTSAAHSSSKGMYIAFSDDFAADLGQLYENKALFPCYSSTHANLICKLYRKDADLNGLSKVYITGFNNIANGETVILWFYRFKNPDPTTTHNVYLSFYDPVTDPDKILPSLTYGSRFSISIESSSYSSSTSTSSSTSVQQTITSLSLNMPSHTSPSVLIYFLNEKRITTLVSSSLTSSSGSCTYHSKGRMLICSRASGGAFSLTASSYVNVLHSMSGTLGGWIGFGVPDSTNKIEQYVQYTSTLSLATFIGVVVQAAGTAGRVYFEFKPTGVVPRGGCVELKFAGTASITKLFGVGMVSGDYGGAIKAKLSGTNIVFLYGFEYISTSSNFAFLLRVTASGSGTVRITSYAYDDSTASYTDYGIEQATSSSVNLASSTTSSITLRVPTFYIISYENLQKASQGFITFKIMLKNALGTKAIRVSPLSSFSLSGISSPLRCRFSVATNPILYSYSSQKCFINTDHIVINAPASASITNTELFEISIFLAETNQQAGFSISSTADKFLPRVYTTTTDASTDNTPAKVSEAQLAIFKVFTNVASQGCVRTFLHNSNDLNLLRFEILTKNVISQYFEIQLSTARVWSSTVTHTLYLKDLGSGLGNSGSYACNFVSGITGIGLNLPSCTLFYGMNGDFVRIVVGAFTSISANSLIKLEIQNVKNPSTNYVYTSGSFYSYTMSGSTPTYIDYFAFPYIVSTASPTAAASSTGTFPTLSGYIASTTVTATIVVNSPSSTTLEYFDGFLLEFDSLFYQSTISASSGALTINTNIVSTTKAGVFVTLAKTALLQTATTSLTFSLSNMKTPLIGADYIPGTMWKLYVIINKFKVNNIELSNSPPTIVGGYFILDSQPILLKAPTVSPSYPLRPNVLRSTACTFTIKFKNMFKWETNKPITIGFPTDFPTVTATSLTISPYSGTRSSSFSSNTLKITLTGGGSIASGTQIILEIDATSSPNVGNTIDFPIKYYNDAAATSLIASSSLQGVNIIGISLKSIKALTPHIPTQKLSYSHIDFLITLPATVTKATGYVTIVPEKRLWSSRKIGGTLEYDDLACFWGDLAACQCEAIDSVAGGFKIWAPRSTDVSGELNLIVQTNRLITNKVDLLYDNYQIMESGKYEVIATLNGGGAVTKFLIIPPPAFTMAYINNYIATKSVFSIFMFSFQPQVNVPPKQTETNVPPNPIGDILIEFPNKNSDGSVLFLPDIGTGYSNGVSLDCLCENSFGVTCPSAMKITCKLVSGGGSIESPSYIHIQAEDWFVTTSTYIFRFPKLKNPSTEKLFLYLHGMSRQYDAVTKTFVILNELLNLPIYYTTLKTLVSNGPGGYAAPVFSPNRVGEPGQLTFSFTQSIGNLRRLTTDRLIVESTTSEMIFELPPTTYRGSSYTLSCTNMVVRLYPISKWVEIQPSGADILMSASSLRINDFKNMPYQLINGGIDFKIYVWFTFDLYQEIFFPITAQALPNVYKPSTKTYTPTNVFIMQPNTYTFTFQPFNRIPVGGMIRLFLPDCAACDFNYLEDYCMVTGGITDASCDIIKTSDYLDVKGLSSLYDPFPQPEGPDISITFYIENPTTVAAPGSTYFKLVTYYDALDTRTVMDQDNTYDSIARYTIQGGDIITATVKDIYESQEFVCPNMYGPLQLNFQFSGDLAYPNDYIELDLYYSVVYKGSSLTNPVICYFNEVGAPKIIKFKTFRCEYNTAGGVLTAYVPEELSPLRSTKVYSLIVYARKDFGLNAQPPSAIYWVMIKTSATADNGWIELRIPPCPFDDQIFTVSNTLSTFLKKDVKVDKPPYYYIESSFLVQSFSEEASKDIVADPTWTGINITIRTTANQIPTGDPYTTLNSRIILEFPTHNEVYPSWDVGLGVVTGGSTEGEVGCAGQNIGTQNPLPVANLGFKDYIYCTAIKADGVGYNTPAYILIQNYDAIDVGKTFNLQITKIANPVTYGRSTFSHIRIRVQSKQVDGTYYDIYYHNYFLLVYAYRSPPNGGAGQTTFPKTGSLQVGHDSCYGGGIRVTQAMCNTSYTWVGATTLQKDQVVVYEYNYPYSLGPRSICIQQKDPYNYLNPVDRPFTGCAISRFSGWLTTRVTTDPDTNNVYFIKELFSFINPDFESKDLSGVAKSELNIYVYSSGGSLREKQTLLQSADRSNVILVLETPESENPVDKVVKYKLGIIIGAAKQTFEYIRIVARDFQTIADPCIVRRGLVLKDIGDPNNKIVCKVTVTNAATLTYLIEIYNFGTYKGDGWFIIDLEMKNPATPKWTGQWTAITYHTQPNAWDQTKIMDSGGGAVTWVGKLPFPNLYRVYRNTISFQNRRAQNGDYAEVHTRLIPKTILPPTTGSTSAWVEIWMPTDFDIPNGGTALCQMGQEYHTDMSGQYCKITADRKIFMNTDKLKGLQGSCSLLSMTTENAFGGDGVKLPTNPGGSSFQLYEYINNNLIEYSTPGVTTQPDPLTVYTFNAVVQEHGLKTIYRFSFKTNIKIPAGYDSSVNVVDPLLKNPIGTIQVDFNTRDNWVWGWQGSPCDLGYGAVTDIPCRAMKGLIGKGGTGLLAGGGETGKKVKCTMVKAKCTFSIFDPVSILVSDFEEVSLGDIVEIHFLDIRTLDSFYNNGRVEVFAFQTNADSTVTQLIKKTTGNIPCSERNYNIPDSDPTKYKIDLNDVLYADNWKINPFNYVGRYTTVDIVLTIAGTLNPQSNIIFTFPSEFELKYQFDKEIQAACNGFTLNVVIYAINSINKLFLEVPAGTTIPSSTVTIRLTNLRNMAYVPALATYSVLVQVNSNGKLRIQENMFINIPSPTAGPFSSCILSLSSYFSGDVNVLYTFSVSLTYRLEAGSYLYINLPNHDNSLPQYIGLSYSHLALSNPPALATTSIPSSLSTTITANRVRVLMTKLVTEGTTITIYMTGAKNPTFVGKSAAADFNVAAYNSFGKLVNQDSFSQITFLAQKTVDVLYMKILATSLYRSVSCDYVFALQPSNKLASQGKVILKFPAAWASETIGSNVNFKISSLGGTFTGEELEYTQSYDPTNQLLTIIPKFDWPARTTLNIELDGLLNPKLISETTVFQAYTEYDGVKLDATDLTDEGLKLKYKDYEPSIKLADEPIIFPKNEGESANYIFNFTIEKNVPKGSSMELSFSKNFDALLSNYDKGIECKSKIYGVVPCTVTNGKIVVNFQNDIAANSNFDLQINGITNPNSNTAGSMDIILRQGDTILSYTNKAATFLSTSAPKWLNMTYLNTSSLNLQEKSNYTLCAETKDSIPLNSSILIEFPKQFSLRQSFYSCRTALSHNALPYITPISEVSSLLRTINITGQTSGYDGLSGTKTLCYQINGVENPSESGESGAFGFSIYDIENKVVLAKTYGNLNFPATLTFARSGLRIVVGSIDTLYVQTMSKLISVTLERSVSYEIYLTPTSKGFEFVPPVVSFFSYVGPTQYFKIKPLAGATLGANKISWSKMENITTSKFSEVPDSFFTLSSTPSYKELKLSISPTISRTALKGTSLPIRVELSVSPAENLTLFYSTYKPSQEEFVKFSPQSLVFLPGETIKTFTYNTLVGAVSGQIFFELEAKFKEKYFMGTNYANFEILDVDVNPPKLINYYIVDMDRTYMYFRISTSENCWVKYLLTLKGTIKPPNDEIIKPELRVTRNTKTDVMELIGANSSYQAPVTKDYIYYDTYLMFTGLEEQTDYILYFLVMDLSDNEIVNVGFPFTTLKKHHPAKFSIILTQDVIISKVLNAFGLITGLQPERFQVDGLLKKFKIPEADEKVVQDLLESQTATYEFTLLQNKTENSIRPIEKIYALDSNKDILKSEIPELLDSYKISSASYEIIAFKQEFSFYPSLLSVGQDIATFNMSIRRNGTLFGIVMEKGSPSPNARQLKFGLSSTNFKLDPEHYVSLSFVYSYDSEEGSIISKTASFTNLYDNTEYQAYFVAENDLPVNPDLMDEKDIYMTSFVTTSEIFVIPETYKGEALLGIGKLVLIILMVMIWI